MQDKKLDVNNDMMIFEETTDTARLEFIVENIANDMNLKAQSVEATIKLIDEGNTIPFIARYRKEVTNGMDDEVLRNLDEKLSYLRNLEARKDDVLRLISEQGKLTKDLFDEIRKATVLQRVEDLYKPFKQKKSTRATKAKEKGIEPLANQLYDAKTFIALDELAKPFLNDEMEVFTTEDAIAYAKDIIAEMMADDANLVESVREYTFKTGVLACEEGKEKDESELYTRFFDTKEALIKIPNHRILAIFRGEKEGFLKVKIDLDSEAMVNFISKRFIKRNNPYRDILVEAIEDGYKRLMQPSVERELRNKLSERAEDEAIKVFAQNTKSLFMTPPVKGKGVISIDPGFRTGCKVAVLDPNGKLLAYTTIYPTEPKKDIEGTYNVLDKIINKFKIDVIAIGNGTASRETQEVVAGFLKKNKSDIKYTIVNEAGASVYSASKLATEEYPELDVTTRGAMSLGRRLQDPMAELVKIDPKHIGVGQYQHDMNQKKLEEALGNVVEDCVNKVGVDLNTASASLLSYVSGINKSVAKNIVLYREENGAFASRKELKKVPKLGDKAFKQCAGFLRIANGKEPLDYTAVHPESYDITKEMMKKLGINMDDVKKGGAEYIESTIKEFYNLSDLKVAIKTLSDDIGIGELTLTDIVSELKKPNRDPREDAPAVIFRDDVKKLEDLRAGMKLKGTVRNVVDFGAFVDIGLKNDALVHISQLSNKFISHPLDVISVGDTVDVSILEVDTKRGKVSLTMKQ